MFDLEPSIADWRQQMRAAGIPPRPLEELEGHLREEIERQMQSGAGEHEAFEIAIQEIGQPEVLKNEFAKSSLPVHERLTQMIFTLAGVSNHQLITTMNTTQSNLEPRWATYAKGSAFIFPAIFLWLFTAVFVLPKVNQICQQAGMTVFDFENAPLIFKILSHIGPLLILCSNHWLVIGGVSILLCVLMERFFDRWPRYRRMVIGVGVFLVNASVLLGLALMIVSILIAVPALGHIHHAH